ncbi:MAG: adenylosuccinate lyase [Pseudomonadota bacterium]
MSSRDQADILVQRYASPEMVELFSRERRILLWRDLWIALAEAERELGVPITKLQIDELKKKRERIDWVAAERREREVRHDVMAHVYAYGLECPKAAGIIHLGATSAYVTDNADLVLIREGLRIIAGKLAAAIDRLAAFAAKERDLVTVAFTHFQAAQPTTVGRRACIWLQNLAMDLDLLEFEMAELCFHGVKGATGTQDSFLKLFDGDKKKVLELDRKVTAKMGFTRSFSVTGQIYPRKTDTRIVSALAMICESASKFASDLRLLQGLHEIEEPREEGQIGSSAMPYKQNPMRCERISSLARYVMNLVGNCYATGANQWLERSLDDSANRRLVLPHAFLVTDAVLDLLINVATGMRVHDGVIRKHMEEELPFFQTEEILMAAVRAGGDRQIIHERIQAHAKQAIKQIREKGAPNDLLARLRRDPAFRKVPPKLLVRADSARLVGTSQEQVDAFLEEKVEPIRRRYRTAVRHRPTIRV